MSRFAYCNETLAPGRTFREQCDLIAEVGYERGGDRPLHPRREARRLISGPPRPPAGRRRAAGLEVIGLHWLLAKTTGMHLTAADPAARRAAADRLIELAGLCADLGGGVLVLGSPEQRNRGGMPEDEASENAVEVLQAVLPTLEDRGVTLALEPLAPNETDFLNTCADTVALCDRVGGGSVRLHQDVKAMVGGESKPPADVIRDYAEHTAHFHANDANLLGPGMGDTDFRPILRALQETNYAGWVSVEVFADGPGGPVETCRQSLANLRRRRTRLNPGGQEAGRYVASPGPAATRSSSEKSGRRPPHVVRTDHPAGADLEVVRPLHVPAGRTAARCRRRPEGRWPGDGPFARLQ